MDKNSIIGILIIFSLLMTYSYLNQPSEAEIAAEKARRDSIAQIQTPTSQSDLAEVTTPATKPQSQTVDPSLPDSAVQVSLQNQYGVFAPAMQGTDETVKLENDFIELTFSSRGGRIQQAILKKYDKITVKENHEEEKAPLALLEDEKNRFEIHLPVPGVRGGMISTGDLFFKPTLQGNTLSLKAELAGGRFIEQTYTLGADYEVDFDLQLYGLDGVVGQGTSHLELHWINYLDKLEVNSSYERMYSTVYYKPAEEGVDYCSCRSDDEESLEMPVKWVSHANQFFNSTLLADESFGPAKLEVTMLEESLPDLKKIVSTLNIPIQGVSDETFGMHFYIGPNEFKRLAAYGASLEDIVPFGWSIFGTINRWLIRPVFNFLSGFIGSAGLVILVLTLLVKLALYPLTYKMLYSQSKMAALKPEITKVRDRFKDDQQKQQMETMKLYREFGANPLGGCFPIALQMPIWFALYRFFPASIEFRQAGFLWATDLSSYDVFMWLPFSVPFYGSHVSMFTLLWAITTIIYTVYNSRQMDMSAMGNPAMKYMQYFMPVMFLFFFNNFAAGLTTYLLFSNVLNITQTFVTKNYIINQEKIKEEMDAYRKKPKKKSGFSQRLEEALKEQQRLAEERKKKS